MNTFSNYKISTRYIALTLLLTVTALFITAAFIRMLNFDESLALHAGWLTLANIDTTPYFYMPFTIILGWLAHLIDDPGTLFSSIRLFLSTALIILFVYSAKALRLPLSVSLLTGFLILVNSTFFIHAIEFRYDWAILFGWIIAFITIYRFPPQAPIILGICVAWLMMHHLKGVYFAAGLYSITIWQISIRPNVWKNIILRFNLALILSLAAWITFSYLSGNSRELWNFYLDFITLSASTEKLWPWQSMKDLYGNDGNWWALSPIIILLLFKQHFDRLVKLTFLFLLIPISFIFVHPHPWAYMYVPLVPFVSLLSAISILKILNFNEIKNNKYTVYILFLSLILILIPYEFTVERVFSATRSNQVETLRTLKILHTPQDTVIDPSGIAYFIRPATDDWYLDTLFRQKNGYAEWTKNPSNYISSNTWMLNTYRISWYSTVTKEFINDTFVPISGSLYIHRNMDTHTNDGLTEIYSHKIIKSFW